MKLCFTIEVTPCKKVKVTSRIKSSKKTIADLITIVKLTSSREGWLNYLCLVLGGLYGRSPGLDQLTMNNEKLKMFKIVHW